MTAQTFYAGARSDEWGTPDSIFNVLHEHFNFALDLAASEDNTKCPLFFSAERSALERPWPHCITSWLNPPFSQAEAFFEKAAAEAKEGAQVVAIYKASNMETATWQKHIFPHATHVLIPRRRVEYVTGGDKRRHGVPFPSAIIGYNVSLEGVAKRIKGTLLHLGVRE